MIKKEEPNILWSSDASHLEKKKKSPKKEELKPDEHKLRLRLEKKARGGKTVSVLYELPENPEYFKSLLKELKAKCGTGGTFKDNRIEIQGDHREKIKIHCESKGFQVVFAGG